MTHIESFLAAAARAARPDNTHPAAALEARAYLAKTVRALRGVLHELDDADENYGADAGILNTEQVRAVINDAIRGRR